MSVINHNGELITIKELVMIERVLHHYGIEVISVSKYRHVYKVQSSVGNLCVRKVSHGRKKVLNSFKLAEALKKNGFHNIQKYYKTLKDDCYVKYGKYIVYVTEWVEGDECNFNDIKEAEKCCELLAQFHKSCIDIDSYDINIKNSSKNLPKMFYESLIDLERFKEIIKHKVIQNQFDYIYNDHIDALYTRGVTALSILNNCNYYNLTKNALVTKSIAHGSFYRKNIIKSGTGYFIITLNSVNIDLPIIDLAKLLRRLLPKSEFAWDFKKALNLLNHYSIYRPIEIPELEILLAFLIFPYKFWKLGYKRYKKHKGFNEVKYLKRLQKLLAYSEQENKFIDDFMRYINNLIAINQNSK
ncbi:CotS family spore coat protein [Clostridium thermarum]|uniref:CotS family spore coat protein n=1 Tax=Clostridium thermarum TaxID=1716543 RepID=UPI0011200DBC|nr:CotS family spore coat protein [Clostridium thermarum]